MPSASTDAHRYVVDFILPDPVTDSSQTPLKQDFMGLPTELRLRTHEYALLLDHSMKSWSETGAGRRDYWQRFHDRKFYSLLIGGRQLNFRLLRTCKTINVEAAKVFYGGMNFISPASTDVSSPLHSCTR
jgi:hypothetical protein